MTGTSTTTRIRLAIALCAGFLAAACGASPASPDAIPTAAGPAFAGSPASDGTTRLNFSVDLTVPAFPVCPAAPVSAGELHGEGVLTVVLRSVTDPNGGTRIGSNIHGHGTATDATGARWVWSDADLNNELFDSGNTSPNSFSQTVHEGFHVIGPKGQKIMVVGTFHITKVNGTTVVEVEHGNHEEGEICESGFALTPLP
ncbi:MAG: hypothetical protein ACRD3G_20100 [Vicinamibacterales bacterium]